MEKICPDSYYNLIKIIWNRINSCIYLSIKINFVRHFEIMVDNTSEKNITVNRKAQHEYFILQRFEAGIVLLGSEVKSLRLNRASLVDSFASVENGEVWLYNANINVYDQASINNHDPVRKRKLLFNKNEIRKLIKATAEKGNTLIPLRLYFKNGKAKVEIAVATGKKKFDKREDIAKREISRELQRKLK